MLSCLRVPGCGVDTDRVEPDCFRGVLLPLRVRAQMLFGELPECRIGVVDLTDRSHFREDVFPDFLPCSKERSWRIKTGAWVRLYKHVPKLWVAPVLNHDVVDG